MANFKTLEVKDASGVPLNGQMLVDGRQINTFRKPPEVTAAIIHNMVNLRIRDDDVMFCSAPKSGTHWGFEIISMLLNGKAETIPQEKIATMLETILEEDLEKLPSPRVLNSHFPLCILPKQMKEKGTKIVLMLRNPKDVSVSFFYHHKGMQLANYQGTFENHHRLFMEGKVEYDDWFDLVLDWEKEIEKGEYKIHLVYYEDLKKNGLEEIKKLAKFLNVSDNDELCKAIHAKCQFDKMAVDKEYPSEIKQRAFNAGFSMFRKGEIGDWKNHFTVAMNEEFDAVYKKRMKGSKLKFQFT